MNERMRSRIHLHHHSSDQSFLKKMNEKYGLSENILPTELGGHVTLDGMGWIENRKSMESEIVIKEKD